MSNPLRSAASTASDSKPGARRIDMSPEDVALANAQENLKKDFNEEEVQNALEQIIDFEPVRLEALASEMVYMSINFGLMVATMLRHYQVYVAKINKTNALELSKWEKARTKDVKLPEFVAEPTQSFAELVSYILSWGVARSGNLKEKQEKKTNKLALGYLRFAMEALGVSNSPASALGPGDANLTRVHAAFIFQIGELHKATRGKYIKILDKESKIAPYKPYFFPGAIALYPLDTSEERVKMYVYLQVFYALQIRTPQEKRKVLESVERQEFIAQSMKYAKVIWEQSKHVTDAQKKAFMSGFPTIGLKDLKVLVGLGFDAEDFNESGFNDGIDKW